VLFICNVYSRMLACIKRICMCNAFLPRLGKSALISLSENVKQEIKRLNHD
jgi:hypothetical protein